MSKDVFAWACAEDAPGEPPRLRTPAMNPFSQARCSAVNGALSGMSGVICMADAV